MENEETPKAAENLLEKYRSYLAVGALGLILLVVGLRLITSDKTQVEFIEESTGSATLATSAKADISGAVVKPGVYTLNSDARIQDLLVVAGGLSSVADRDWVDKYVNLAARVVDGSKLYIPKTGEYKHETNSESVLAVQSNEFLNPININTASVKELDELPGVGEVTSAKIIDNRPYTSIDELLTKKVVNKGTFEKIKDKISIY